MLKTRAGNSAFVHIDSCNISAASANAVCSNRTCTCNSGENYMEFDWENVARATSYYSEYRESGTTSWSGGTTTTSSVRRITGLDASTTYEFRVR